MTIILLNSSVDNFIINLIVGSTAAMFLFKWARHKLKTKNHNLSSLLSDEMENRFNNYTLSFENNEFAVKQFGTKTKITSILISLIIVTIPLHEFIETLRPQTFYYGWSCFPNF